MPFLKRTAPFLAKMAISGLLMWLLFRKADWPELGRLLLTVSPAHIFVALGLTYLAWFLTALRWLIILRTSGLTISIATAMSFVLIGSFFSQVLPSSVSGDGIRIWLIYRRGVSLGQAAGSVLVDRVAGVAFLVLLCLAGIPAMLDLMPRKEMAWALVFLDFSILAGLVTSVALARAEVLPLRFRAMRLLVQIALDLYALLIEPRKLLAIAATSICSQLASCILLWLLVRDLGSPISLTNVIIVAPAVFLLLIVPVSIAGWGVREGLLVFGLGLIGTPTEVALGGSILFGLVYLAASLAGGVIWMFRRDADRATTLNLLKQ